MRNARPAAAAIVLAVTAACSSLPTDPSGVVALNVSVPDSLGLGTGDSLQLHAVALDIKGDSVAAAVRWRTPDTANIALDSLTGLVIAKVDTGSARVQASAGTLLSNIITLTLRPDSTSSTSIRAAP